MSIRKMLADQDRAIQLYGQVAEHTPLDAPELPQHLHNLCSCLLGSFCAHQKHG